VSPESILLLPVDPDASATRLRHQLEALTGLRLGVVISDTAGRAWRIGQTDQAIGSSGVRVIDRYEGRHDPYGNELRVTAVAVADELAGAADLVKTKLSGRPVAVVRGLAHQLADDDGQNGERGEEDAARAETRATVLVRDESTDMFRYGSREAVVAAVLRATGQSARYEEVLEHTTEAELVDAVLRGSGRSGAEAELLRLVLAAAFTG
jgi:coenzyme F420-0:L-glutamate ligase/coenzyme F420-1:gamma-L-glutamate ligase